jgi:hypothetical protein
MTGLLSAIPISPSRIAPLLAQSDESGSVRRPVRLTRLGERGHYDLSMTTPTGWTMFTFRDDGEAPAEVAGRDSQSFLFPNTALTGLGSGESNPGTLDDIKGWHRVNPDGSHDWVMTSEITGAIKDQILAIPEGLGWVNQTMDPGTPLRVVVNVARQLRQAGIAGPDVITAVRALVRAGRDNRNAQIAAGG